MRPFPDEAIFATVGRHCALPLGLITLRLPHLGVEQALDALRSQGFSFVNPSPATTALDWVGKAKYQHAAAVEHAPELVDCSGFVMWVFGQWGIRLPRFSIEQSRLGVSVDGPHNLLPGDLVFSRSRHNRQFAGDPYAVGHAGIYVADNTIAHASRERGDVSLTSVDEFWRSGFAGCRRILPARLLTAVIPEGWYVQGASHLLCNMYDALTRNGRD